MLQPTRLRAAGVVISAVVAAAGGVSLAGMTGADAAQAAPPRVSVPDSHPSWATPAHLAGAAAVSSGSVRTRVYLAPRNAARLARLVAAVSKPRGRSYRHFLTPAQLQARFGTPASQVSAIRSWLSGAGLKVTAVSNHVAGGFVAATGSVAAASRAFGVTFGRYHLAGQGIVRAPEQAATVPSGVARSVLAVTGLSTARTTMHPMTKLPPPGPNYWVAKPCGKYYNQKIATDKPRAYGKHWPWAVCGYTPKQVRGAYGVTTSGMTGAGQTVAIVDAYASPTMESDADTYASVVGDQPFSSGQYQQYLPTSFTHLKACGPQGWYGEQTLDVESVHGLAPSADIRFVAAASCYDTDLAAALALIVNQHLASIVSDSWGDTEAGALPLLPVYHEIFEAGAAEGIAFMFSSGDNGYESPAEDPGSGHIQVDYPTSDPLVTSVGGTSLAIGANDNYMFETAWGTLLDPLAADGRSWQYPPPGKYPEFYDGSSGGGTSTVFRQPWYQQGVVPARLSTRLPDGSTSSTPMRVVPDVAAYADPATGFLVGETSLLPDGKYGFALSRIGGTSVACPTFAGIEADAQSAAGGPLGFANPMIYFADTHDVTAFHDVTDHPFGHRHLAQVRANYTNPYTRTGPVLYYLRTLGLDGEGAAALRATRGYDDATGVGSPDLYISFVSRYFSRRH